MNQRFTLTAGCAKPSLAAAKRPFLQELREEKGISQRSLARAAGVPRSYVQRMEAKPWLGLSIHELELFSRGLAMKLEELIRCGQNHLNAGSGVERASLAAPFFQDKLAQGAGFASLIKNPRNYFVGSLVLEPQQGIQREQAPRGEFLFCYVLQGMLLLSLFSKEHVFKEQECFSLPAGDASYELFNPHQFHKSIVLMMALPSFSRMGA